MVEKPLLRVDHLSVEYAKSRRWTRAARSEQYLAVNDVSFELAEGETLGLVGESGAGKSTIGNCVVRLVQPTSGSIEFAGRDITHLRGAQLREQRRDIQMVFQDPFSSLDPFMRVRDVIEEPLRAFGIGTAADRRAAVDDLLEVVGLNRGHADRFPSNFSGGQRQRIAIARALTIRPKLIVCDEAVSALDVSVRAQILNLLRDVQEQFGTAYLFISHDLLSIRAMSDRVAVLNKGRMVEIGSSDDVFLRPKHAHTRELLAALPEPVPAMGQPSEIPSGSRRGKERSVDHRA
jgi:oligopeptide transport system ATP-binding protein